MGIEEMGSKENGQEGDGGAREAIGRDGDRAGARVNRGSWALEVSWVGPGGERSGQRPGWALSLSLIFFSRKELERRKEERVRERICACGQFSRTHKNELDPRKIEVGMTESLNSNSFDLNSNDLNRK